MPAQYTCLNARQDMDFFFKGSKKPGDENGKIVALHRAVDHMTAGSAIGHHNVACQKCWDRYMQLKRALTGG